MSIQRTPAGTWLVRWRDPEHRHRGKAFRRKFDAQTFETRIRHELATGEYVDPHIRLGNRSSSYVIATGTLVYVAYGIGNEVLYVGVTDDLFGRMAGHRSRAKWWPELRRLEWEEWPDRARALQQEAALVAKLKPIHNYTDKPNGGKAR